MFSILKSCSVHFHCVGLDLTGADCSSLFLSVTYRNVVNASGFKRMGYWLPSKILTSCHCMCVLMCGYPQLVWLSLLYFTQSLALHHISCLDLNVLVCGWKYITKNAHIGPRRSLLGLRWPVGFVLCILLWIRSSVLEPVFPWPHRNPSLWGKTHREGTDWDF